MCGCGGIQRDGSFPGPGIVEGEGRGRGGCFRRRLGVEGEGDEAGCPVWWGCGNESQTESECQWG